MLAAAWLSIAVVALERVQVEQAPPPPPGWRVIRASPPEALLELMFAVKQTNIQALHDSLMSLSDPSSPAYGRHMTNEQVHRLIAPTPASLAAVEGFLRSHGLEPRRVSPNGDLIQITLSVQQAERLLSTSYFEHVHDASGAVAHRVTSGYSLPPDVAAAVDFACPTTHLPATAGPTVAGLTPKPSASMPSLASPHAGAASLPSKAGKAVAPSGGAAGLLGSHNTPKTLRQLYSVGSAQGSAPSNVQAVTAFLEQKYSPAALNSFWEEYCDGIACGKGEPKLVGDHTQGAPGVEAMLDIETITGVAGNISSEFWGFGGRSPDNPHNEPFLKWLSLVSSTTDEQIPKIFSTSYGEDEASWSPPAAARLNVEFLKAGSRGITLLFAAGDEGANCKGGRFIPEGPGSSPYVTAVGGTTPAPGFPLPGSETAVGLSSGGFSSYWPMPSWQQAAVQTYLSSGADLPSASRGYNTSGRAYPDIAAQATSYCVTPFGCGVAGTSCASPAAAGVFSLLNDLRLQMGKSTLGFVNPLIYKNMAAFNDVTTGSSSGCFLGSGWPAAKGWDAVTGVGTPNYQKLAKVVAALP